MRCGDCNAMITAEEKWKHQKNGNVHHYIYYHCTRRKDPTCRQGSVEEKKLIEMMTEFLAELGVSSSFAGWAGQSIESFAAGQEEHEKEAKASIEKQLEKVARSLSELTRMRYQGLIDDQEFEREKSALLMEKNALADSLTGVTANSAQWKEGVSSVFNLMATVVERFANGDNATRRSIMSEIGSNLLLKDKIFICEAKIPYLLVQNAYRQILEVSKGLEPPENIAAKPRNPYFADVSRLLWTLVNDVRTYFMTNATEHMTTLPMDDCPEVSSIGGD
jgi:hypothetical protein